MRRIKKILFAVLAGIIPMAALSQFNESREFAREFKALPETQVEITNKYGNVEINTWEKDSVVFKIKINVEERKLSKLEKTMQGIDFDFTSSSHFIIARTIVNKTSSFLEKELLKFKESLLRSDSNVEIDYTVWVPVSSSLKIENKFGNIIIGEFAGSCDITLSNGNLKAHEFKGKTKINLNFADASINSINTAQLITNFSEVDIKAAETLRIESKSSTFEIMEINELNVNSRRDKYRIRLASLIDAEGSFTHFRISELEDRINIRSDYGDLDIETINPEFSIIFIESKSTDINLYFNLQSTFSFEITGSKTEMDFCREIEIEDEIVLDEKDKKIKYKGKFGEEEPPAEKLYINTTSGRVNILTD